MIAAAILFGLAVFLSASFARAHGSDHDSQSLLGTTNGIMHAFVEFPMGIGAGLAGSFMAVGDWQTAYTLGGTIFGLAFILYYFYFARLDVRDATLEPATARSRA